MGVPDAEVRMIEGMYEKTTARVVVGEGASEVFLVQIELRQGSVLSPLLFIAVLDLTSRMKVMKIAMKKLLYADGLTLVANGKQELKETMEEWNGLFTRHGLNNNLDNSGVLHIGYQREELDIELEGKNTCSFVYLGGQCAETGRRRGRYVEAHMPERTRGEQLRAWWRSGGSPKDKSQGNEHLCNTGMPVRNGNLGNDRTTTTKAASVRKQLGRKIATATRAN